MPQVTQQQWITIAVSVISSGLLSAVVAGLYSLRAKRNDYVNDYYKIVIQRRIAAYEALERLIFPLKTAVVDEEDNRSYHFLFC